MEVYSLRGRADERMEKMYGVRKSEYVEEEGSEGIGQVCLRLVM